jgi:CBS domain containing-hemolysin-like protein
VGAPVEGVMSGVALILILALLVVLVVGSALFSAIETAFFSLQPYHMERLKARRADFAAALQALMENPRRLLSAILLADGLVNLPLVLICLFLLRGQLVAHVPFWVAALLIFGLVVFVCDLVPKVAALIEPYRIMKIGVRVMRWLLPVIDPLARVLQGFSEWVVQSFIPVRLRTAHSLTAEELDTLVELSTEEGALHATESEMIQEIIKLGDKTARDCMTPRVDCFAVPDDLTNEDLIANLHEHRFRRVPVYGDTPDEILGLLDVRRFLTDPQTPYAEMIDPPSFVPETMRALDLLRSFLRHPQPMAIVVDEHGGTEGIITMADIIEEIISDAVPSADRELYIEPLGGGRLIVDGGARLDDINEQLGTQLAEEGIDTIGGLVFNRLGTLPKPGAEMKIEDLRITVRRTSRKRVEELLIVREQEE